MGKVYRKVKREVIRVWYTMVFLYKEKWDEREVNRGMFYYR